MSFTTYNCTTCSCTWAVQHTTVQHAAVQHAAVQHTTVQHAAVQRVAPFVSMLSVKYTGEEEKNIFLINDFKKSGPQSCSDPINIIQWI